MYTFSTKPVAEFYGRPFYSISNSDGQVVAYSEKVFDVPKEVRFLGADQCLIFEKAEIRGGEIRGGVIRGGVIRGGVIRGGVIRGGVIWGGEIRGGVIWGGEIWGGVIRGGVIWGGYHEFGTLEVSLLQIQGTRHFCYAYFNEALEIELGIGCERHSIEWWQENYKKVGSIENYTQDEIDEYAQYIQLFASRYNTKK